MSLDVLLKLTVNRETTVAAILLFGDPRHTAGQPYSVGTGAGKNSYYPRSGGVLDRMGAYAPVLRSYCASTDPICAQGDDVATHLDYFLKWTDDAARWARSMVDMKNTTSATSASEKAASSMGAGDVTSTSTSSGLPTAAETDRGTTATSSATGSATPTATSDSGVAGFRRNQGLAWTVIMMMGLYLLVGQ
jgi:hypothetical protein